MDYITLSRAELLLFKAIGQHSDVMKSKMAACGKFIRDNKSKSFPFTLIIIFPLSSKICV